jgi:hypothetical protein
VLPVLPLRTPAILTPRTLRRRLLPRRLLRRRLLPRCLMRRRLMRQPRFVFLLLFLFFATLLLSLA